MTVKKLIDSLANVAKDKEVTFHNRLKNGTVVRGKVIAIGLFHATEITVYGQV